MKIAASLIKKDNKNKGKRRLKTKRQSLYKMIIKLYGIRDQDIPRGHYKGFSIDDSVMIGPG